MEHALKRQQFLHELDLVGRRAQEELAEFTEIALRKIAAAIEIVDPFLVGSRQGLSLVQKDVGQRKWRGALCAQAL